MRSIQALDVEIGQTIQFPNQDILFNSLTVNSISVMPKGDIIFTGTNKDTGKLRGLRVHNNKVLNLIENNL